MRKHLAWLWVLLLSAGSIFSQAGSTLPVVSVEESKIRFSTQPHSQLELPLVNRGSQSFDAYIDLELLKEDGKAVATTHLKTALAQGSHAVVIPWPTAFQSNSISDVYWWRLHYSVTPSTGSAFTPQDGIVAVSRIIRDFFGIQVSTLHRPLPGSSFPLRVRIADPLTDKGVAGVHVQAEFKFDDEVQSVLSAVQTAKTDVHGVAVITLKIPADADGEPSVEVTAQRGSWRNSKTVEFEVRDRPTVTVSTDKPIYQPGQVLHLRALVLGPDNHVRANTTATFQITDEDGADQFQANVKTSEFGVAQTDWEIPQKVQLGDYEIRVNLEEGSGMGLALVRISRYELPTFAVSPSTDKTFYLPGQRARVEVQANYLFGQPVKRGTVRIIRDNGRTWNSSKKEYDEHKEEVLHGELDSTAKFAGTLDFNEDFEELRQSDYLRFRDIRYAAYVTDLSTNRTEQKHFNVRLSKDPIHIYVFGHTYSNTGYLDAFVTTALPDGKPASVAVTINAVKPEASGAQHSEIAHLRTNKYGIGYFQVRAIPPELLDESHGDTQLQLVFEAGDRRIGKAIHTEQLSLDDGPFFRIRAKTCLLHAGDNITAEIESSLPDQSVFVDLLSDRAVLGSQRLDLRHGHADVEFSYDEKFHNQVMLVAYTMHVSDEHPPLATAAVLYPEPQDLDLGVHLRRTSYKPGEAALAKFNVHSPDGRPARSALGIVIYDQAVAERVRTDLEFGRYGFYFGGFDYNEDPAIAGISYRDLLNRKLIGPVPPDLELLARSLLATRPDNSLMAVESKEIGNPSAIFSTALHASLFRVEGALNFSTWIPPGPYPQNMDDLRAALNRSGINFDELRDPWGMPFHARFYTENSQSIVEILSSGPDKLANTNDDFVALRTTWQYFAPLGNAINQVTASYASETGAYIRDFNTLAREMLARRGIDLTHLMDPWGHPYRFAFDIDRANYQIEITSAGPNGVFEQPDQRSSDDVVEWTSQVHYFQRETTALDSALSEHFDKTHKFPRTEDDLRPVLQAAALSPESLLDPWGRPYHFVFSSVSRFSDEVEVTDYSVYGEQPRRQTNVIPVTQQLGYVHVVSYGPNNNPDEKFQVTEFSRVMMEQSSKDLVARKAGDALPPSAGATGAISGTVTDPVGAVIPGATVTATNVYTNQQFEAACDSYGKYLFRNLPAGRYKLGVIARGFQTSVVLGIPVTSSNLTTVDVSLNVGTTNEVLEVTAEAPLVETTQAMVTTTKHGGGTVRIQAEQQAFTPRLRKYFPETLLWQPELDTDSSGKAQLKFAMADNITTWKMSVIASTTSGQLGIAEKELHTFQPFFIDHEPPKILTQGDQIQLPVILRNYLNKPQQVHVKFDPSSWFSLLGPARQQVEVPAGQEALAQFSINVDHAIRDGKERITAANSSTGDALERSIAVHPDGEEVSQTVAALLSGSQDSLNLEVPLNAIPGSIDAELKIFPNMGAHVLDSLNALAVRPAGCGEQITSIAFASVVALQLLRKAGQDDPDAPDNPNAQLTRRARKYVFDAYQQLVRLQSAKGGFPYWMDRDPDLAVTAHALDFLVQASQFIDVEGEVLTNAQRFLVSQQQQDGAWLRTWHNGKSEIDVPLTALITRVLAETAKSVPDDAKTPKVQPAISRGMTFLEARIAEWKDPYVVAQYALAASISGRAEYVSKARELLGHLAHEEGPGTYWNLEANTSPFYSWGRAGRLETTGLAVRALAHLPEAVKQDSATARLLDRGLIYLLSNKDRYGVWYSTQATINVLRGIVDALPVTPEPAHSASVAEVRINGKLARTLNIPSSVSPSGPVAFDVSGLLQPGDNKVELRGPNSSPLQAQLISTHYLHWSESVATKNTALKTGETRALRLNVQFDHTESQIGQSIQCKVEAERIGFSGYGMMLAEVGLPPGAELDRDSLQQEVTKGEVSEYDVLPDRVVFYLWPRAGGSKFNFSFKPRFAMNASAAPSILYDYYNPDAHATVAPARFVVH